jgi:ATP-binding cassette subfamily B protein
LVGFPLVDFPFLGAVPSAADTHRPSAATPLLRDAIDADAIPYADDGEAAPTAPAGAPAKSRAAAPRYPLVAAQGTREEAIACFQMLCLHHRIPFRREVMRRALEGRSNTRDSISLQLCGSMAEFVGFNPQLVQVPATKIGLLNSMALIHWQGHLAVMYECSDREVILGVPGMGDRGLLRLSPQEFGRHVEAAVPVLLLQVTKETPKQRFGLNWFLPYITKYRKGLWEVLIASFFVQLFSLANPLMIQVIIDKVLVQNGVDTLQILGIFLLVIALFEGILTSLRTYLFADITNRIDLALGSEIIDHLLRLPLRYFERRPVGELATRVNELENIRQFLTGTALTVVLDVLFSIIYVVVMFIYSWQLSLVTLGTIPFFLALTFIATPILRRLLRTRAERNAETQAHLVEVVSGIQTVKAQNIELRSRWQWQERYSKYVSAGFRTTMTSATAGAGSHFLNQLSGLLVLWVGAYMVLTSEGQFTLGALIAFRIIAGYVTTPLLRLVQLWQNFQETALSLERLSDIVDTPTEAEINRSTIAMPRIQGHVVFEDVSFRFAATGPMQLTNINLDIPEGTFIGIVGQSGSGKSTLLKLLPRLYDPQGGRILIDAYDIAKVELYSLRSQLGLVPQEPLLFDGTVEENIALVVPDATSEEIIEAAKLAVAHEFIMDLPNGYNTRVGERGSALSGGQRQRIAIARTILQNPRLLILDEATSALDYNTERQVCRNIIQAFRGRTVLFITHRLSTIQNADRILLMDSGMVAEQGTHTDLMGLRGRYFGLYMQQEAQFV